jgi:hypothetical protein
MRTNVRPKTVLHTSPSSSATSPLDARPVPLPLALLLRAPLDRALVPANLRLNFEFDHLKNMLAQAPLSAFPCP